MINKNKFSIKDTKKVLHKVGKKWVVVSAVLLGLAAGGAAVTNANADTTAQAAQPNVAQQVNANESVANHSFGAADPANTTRLGADFGNTKPTNNVNDVINGAKAKVSAKASSVKARIQQNSSYADVNNLTKLANTVRGNASATSAYQNLGSLAASASDYNSLTLGNTSAPASNTVFSMFSQASNDFTHIANAQANGTKGQSYLNKITSGFSKVNSYVNDTTISSSFNSSFSSASNIPTSTEALPSFSSNVTAKDISGLTNNVSINLSGKSVTVNGFNFTTSTIPLSAEVSLNASSLINSGINISNAVSSLTSVFSSEASYSVESSAISAAQSNDGANLHNQVNSIISNEVTPQIEDQLKSKANMLAEGYYTAYQQDKTATGDMKNIDDSLLRGAVNKLNSHPTLKGLISQIQGLSNTPNVDTTIDGIVDKAIDKKVPNKVNDFLNEPEVSDEITDKINSAISTAVDNQYTSTINSLKNQFTNLLGQFVATQGNTSNTYSFGPFENDKLSNVISYLDSFNKGPFNRIGAANSGLSFLHNEKLQNLASGILNNLSSVINKAEDYDNDLTTGLNKFFGTSSTTKSAYNNLISAVSALPNDLQSTSNVSSGDTEEAKLYNDYSNIAHNTSDIDSAAMAHMATYNNGRVKRYISDIARDATNSIVNEASSSASSMLDKTIAFSLAASNVNNVYNSINNIKANSASYTNYSDALAKATNDSLLVNKESSAYNNSLVDSFVSASAQVSDADNISLVSKQSPTNNVISETVDYMNGRNKVGSHVFSNVIENSSVSSLATAPSGYEFNDGNTSELINLNGQSSEDIAVKPVPSDTDNGNNNSGSTNIPTNPIITPTNMSGSYIAPSNASETVEPTSATNNNISSIATKKHVAKANNYVKVNKALQLHTNPNFTKRNVVAVVKPGTTFKIEKAVKANNGAARYEVRYNKKNYFITANKRWVSTFNRAKKATKHMSYANNYVHYRYAKVVKALQLHTSANFTKRNGVMVVRPGTEFHINRIVKNHGLVRYAVRYRGHNYFITANHKYTVNAYVQKYNYRKHGYKAVRVITPLNEYRKLNFAKRSFIRHFYRGSVLPVKKVITIASGEMTRLELTNGRYVTANKDFVEPIR